MPCSTDLFSLLERDGGQADRCDPGAPVGRPAGEGEAGSRGSATDAAAAVVAAAEADEPDVVGERPGVELVRDDQAYGSGTSTEDKWPMYCTVLL